jgi:NADP-dependent aldehyde dehydrogenase
MTATFAAHDPRTGEVIASYSDAEDSAIDAACAAAAEAVPALKPSEARIALLRAAARRLRGAGPALHAICERETGLPRARLEGELERTCVQLELFAELIDEGSYVEAMIDTADPDAEVAPRPDIRRMLVPVGPVAVFGASNFPYAFSVAGGDTASALAAGCPVVIKAHPSHPGTSELVAAELAQAASESGLPAGTVSLVHGASSHVGERLVQAPEIEAVGFTGSIAGGRALYDIAAARPKPIPVYAEMGSVNPVILTAGALAARSGKLAEGLAVSATGGTGQFCTKPGVVLIPDGQAGDAFVDELGARLGAVAAGPLLNERILQALSAAVAELERDRDVRRVSPGNGAPAQAGYLYAPVAFTVEAATVTRRPELLEERFGPFVLLVRYGSQAEIAAVLAVLGGQLTATLHAQPEEHPGLGELVALMEAKAGRVIFDGFPTGVAVTHAMHHGGPYPASSAPSHTSVGSTAIRRFMRPVAWQNAPAELLPEALRDENPLGIWRRVNGALTRDPLHHS